MYDTSEYNQPMGPGREAAEPSEAANDGDVGIEILRTLVHEWFEKTPNMPRSLKHEGFWMRTYAMMIGREDQVAQILDPLLDEPLPPILAVMLRARLRRFAEECGDGARAAELAHQEHAIARAADDEHFKVLALSAMVPYLSRVMELRALSKETTRIALLGHELCNRTLDNCIKAATGGGSTSRSLRQAIYVCTTVEGFQNLHLWLMVERFLDAGIYELAPDFVNRRRLALAEMFAEQANLDGHHGKDSFFRILAAWELSVYEHTHGLAPTTEKSPEQWREAALARAHDSEGWFQPDQADLQSFAIYSFSLASKPSAFEAIGTGIIEVAKVMRMALVHRVDARLATTPAMRALFEEKARVLEESAGVTWPHYNEHVALGDIW